MLIPLQPAPIRPLLTGLDWWMVMAYTKPQEILHEDEDTKYVFIPLVIFEPAGSHIMMRN